jgi:hypothetical protein
MKCLSLFILKGSILGPSAFVPVRVARLVLQGKSRASEVVKHDQFASALRVSLVSAEGTGRIQLGESALDRDPLSLLKPDPRAETRKVGGNASSVADEFEVSALSWTAVTKSGATLH